MGSGSTEPRSVQAGVVVVTAPATDALLSAGRKPTRDEAFRQFMDVLAAADLDSTARHTIGAAAVKYASAAAQEVLDAAFESFGQDTP